MLREFVFTLFNQFIPLSLACLEIEFSSEIAIALYYNNAVQKRDESNSIQGSPESFDIILTAYTILNSKSLKKGVKMKALISPISIEEAKKVVAGGCDIADIKNVGEGSLGAQAPWVIKEIVELFKGNG